MRKSGSLFKQYKEIKAQYPDAILFFRVGDFYEMFFDDARVASAVLEITLTSRDKDSDDPIPMCGVPYHSAAVYIARLVNHGHRVAICEQVEDPRESRGIVRREVIRVVTPGLTAEPENLEALKNNFLLTLIGNGPAGVAYLDISTGEFRLTELADATEIRAEIDRIDPREVVLPSASKTGGGEGGQKSDWKEAFNGRTVTYLDEWIFDEDHARRLLLDQFQTATLEGFGVEDFPLGLVAAGALLHYVRETQRTRLEHVDRLLPYHRENYMLVDNNSKRNLEIFVNLMDGARKGTLLEVLDLTITAMGARTLRSWLNWPLMDRRVIESRLDAVEELVSDGLTLRDLRGAMKGVRDLERITGKVVLRSANPRDLVALRDSLHQIPEIKKIMSGLRAELLAEAAEMDSLEDIKDLLGKALVDEPPSTLREGGIIRKGYHPDLDELRSAAHEGKGWIARMEASERERTGIPNLRVGYNRVFGYYIEVTRSHIQKVPDDYVRKQTLTNAERYINQELKEYENRVLGAEERMLEIEQRLFSQIIEQVAHQAPRLRAASAQLARADALASLAEVASRNRYVRPLLQEDDVIEIEEGRHPVVEQMELEERFVPNDIRLDCLENQLIIITGPNMAGKSTFMRQVALMVLMAQAGSFIPADRAKIGIVDRIFTRIGATDYLARGLSTFMVEMVETANILNNATPRSLILLDEIGRGTSTFDGLSIAWAVAEYLHDMGTPGPRVLFATHYHELTDLSRTKERVRNFNILVREWEERIIFLRKIQPGSTSRSYGIQVARLAGLPAQVLERAREILANLEDEELDKEGVPRLATGKKMQKLRSNSTQLQLFGRQPHRHPVIHELKSLDINRLTPLQAINILERLCRMIRKES
ncbi:MAG: DNA mismatch repair protein MutS [Deltaproteobacteria bacterium]|nr:DNA mismatch repair protein MutS [Deltaproteobacteria bacterium]MBW2307842.1 DNA mismatch repair protein MutS [Deltaproteobacteria bacterium]